MERGIVVSPFTSQSTTDSFSLSTNGLTADKLRYYLVYWDKIAVANNNIFYSPVSGEAASLKDMGIVQEVIEKVNLSGMIRSDSMPQMHFEALARATQSLTSQNPNQWTIHQLGESLIIPPNYCEQLATVDIALNNCLPVPSPDISLDKILNFKSQRADELQALRLCLDELYLEVSKSQDIPRAKNTVVQRLEVAIKNLNLVAEESWFNRVFASRTVSIDVNASSIGQGITNGTVVAGVTANPIFGLVAGAATTLVSSIKFEATLTKQVANISGNKLELSYISSLKNSGIIG